MTSQKILYVEDDVTLGDLFMSVFKKTSHGATWFVRARSTKGGLVFMDSRGVETRLADGDFEIALVDFRLKGSALDGPEVTSHLVAAGIPVVGISGLFSLNDLLVKAGARGAVVKDDLFRLLLHRKIVITRDFTGES